MLRILALTILLGLLQPFKAWALDGDSAIFYPLPGQEQGTFVAAKNLFVGSDGGLWIHDVHGKVQYFDGNTILPKRGSLLEFPSEQVAFYQGIFWTFVENEVFQTFPNQPRQLAFSLEPGSEIRRIGSSDGYIWVSDGVNFYSFNIESKEMETISLLSLYQNNQSSYVYINDAKRVVSKWILGTTAGAYLSQGDQFTHIKASSKHFVSKLYFSATRRELLVGSLNGAVLIDILKPSQENVVIGDSHVLSMVETDQEYWVGTEHGLYSYSFLTGKIVKVRSSGPQDLNLENRKIYSLVNDEQGGIWIATNRGILYYSIFSRKFERVSNVNKQAYRLNGGIKKMAYDADGALWFIDSKNLYRVVNGQHTFARVRLPINVLDFAISSETIWIASDNGIYLYNSNQFKLSAYDLPNYLKGKQIDYVSVGEGGKVWLSSGYRLFSIDIPNDEFRDYGDKWIVSHNLPARVLGLEVDQTVPLIIRTDHGAYVLQDDKIRFERNTQALGESIDIAEAKDGALWFAGTHGIYRKSPSEKALGELALPQENVKPICLISDVDGMWMVSSIGLSFYNVAGELRKHFGFRSGIMSNEFLEGACTSSAVLDLEDSILALGSKFGLVFASRNDLMVSKLPEPRVVVSMVRIDDRIAQVGQPSWDLEPIDYGSSITFVVGVMPNAYGQVLYYRLNQERWVIAEAGQISFEHLAAGDYVLSVKVGLEDEKTTEIAFSVKHPWYQTTLAMIVFALLFIAVGTLIVYWRSRYVSKQNKELMALVALKTNQLRHQSRILLTSNQQLRKQIEVRNLLVDNAASSLRQSIALLFKQLPLPLDTESQQCQTDIVMQLNEIEGAPDNVAGGQTQNYNVNQIVKSVVDVWQDDLKKLSIQVRLNGFEQEHRIALEKFNLDVIFNTIFASVLKRSYRGQEFIIILSEQSELIEVSFIDFGQSCTACIGSKDHDGKEWAMMDSNVEKLPFLVEESGGRVSLFSGEERNKIEILWPKAQNNLCEIIPIKQRDNSINNVKSHDELSPEQSWLMKVESLVQQNYTNPDFGTAMAAKMLFVSERSLQRRFKSLSSRTFTEFLTEVRLEKACESLLAGDKVVDVAFATGFNDPSYFSQRFKLYFGISPSKFVNDTHETES
ncbi:helix-turn-helix domain-containing protein [Vibrio vulnificus]|nr:helix-turn-helix domain-containing protein [Vibrio vulnificus]